eukprot:CAMPEP_0183334896 /NCGR_PEP_ID=MMETSP0164_2-20130417/3362_1 /TAXON_ID=221442 /ORGANISM="Coccolithus pelagicus ssp braarudi, Strain PLY182g" /LENGTH=58 /DNA_ID=CAMNT_0025504137 /DNA_START=366 /DNA_END=539 /DNA_ORIENTATION=+
MRLLHEARVARGVERVAARRADGLAKLGPRRVVVQPLLADRAVVVGLHGATAARAAHS